ncbi:MAG: hypothetical protein E7599_05885 [Ruminococcaceae bacterium]|nr:hypothetical protein [Oscillospiraceae bacterium]
MRNMKYLAFILALLLLLSACGTQIKPENAEPTPKPDPAPGQENEEPTPKPDPAPEVKPEPDPEIVLNINYDLTPTEEELATNIYLLRETIFGVVEFMNEKWDMADFGDKNPEREPFGRPIATFYGTLGDRSRTDAVDAYKAVPIKKDMPAFHVYGLIEHPHAVVDWSSRFSAPHQGLDLDAFYVLDNGQILVVTYYYDRRDNHTSKWFVKDAVVGDIDSIMGDFVLKKQGNLVGLDPWLKESYSDIVERHSGDPGTQVGTGYLLYEWPSMFATQEAPLIERNWFIKEGDEYIAVHISQRFETHPTAGYN